MNNPLYDNLFGVHLENDAPFLYLLDGQTITYRKFLAKSGRIANALDAAARAGGKRKTKKRRRKRRKKSRKKRKRKTRRKLRKRKKKTKRRRRR